MIIPMLLLLLSSSASVQMNWHYVPFDDAMKKKRYPNAIPTTERIIGLDGNTLL